MFFDEDEEEQLDADFNVAVEEVIFFILLLYFIWIHDFTCFGYLSLLSYNL